MAWDPTLATPRDYARLLLGDTDDANQLLLDATYDASLARYGYNLTVGKLARGLATRFAQQPDEYDDEGGVQVRWRKRVDQWNLIAERYDPVASTDSTVGTGYQFISTVMGQPDDQPRRRTTASGARTGMRV